MPSDLRTRGIVLRRTNYGESDRILSVLTPEGKIAVLAKGVRKEKSKLAGGIELFCVSDIVVHQKPTSHSAAGNQNIWSNRSGLAILTGAKMLQFYSQIIADIARLELASDCLKKLERIAEQADNPHFFDLLEQTLCALNRGVELELVAAWFYLNLAHASGEEINLLRDTNGAPLSAEQTYAWDGIELALRPAEQIGAAPIDARAIKLARLMLTQKLSTICSVDGYAALLPALEPIWKCYKNTL